MSWPTQGSLLDIAIESRVRTTLERHFASPGFKSWLGRRIRWSIQGFEPGYDLQAREAFTTTVAARIMRKARRPVYFMGKRIWRARVRAEWAANEAERIVSDFIRGEGIKFGDNRYCWKDGFDLADDDMSYWEACP